MKTVVIYSFNSKEKATAKAADFEKNGYHLDIFEEAVDISTCDFSATNGGECATDGGIWIVAGTKK